MRKVFLIAMCIILLYSFITFLHSQDSSKSEIKWGIGISSPIFSYSRYTYIIPESQNAAISFPIFFSSKFKLEPFVNLSAYRDESKREPLGSPSTTDEVEYQSVTIGAGIFYSKLNKKTRWHFGGKLGYIKSRYESNFDGSGFLSDTEDKGKGYLFSPIIGGEYFFSDHFSLGGEANFEWSVVDNDGEERFDSSERKFSSTIKRYNTTGIIHIRIYFN